LRTNKMEGSPLTAYISWLCGWVSHHVIGPDSVALDDSRGMEDPIFKAYMRATVLVLDLSVYGTAVWYSTYRGDKRSLWAVMIALIQPAILWIDHGHFQYNTVALGLSIAAFASMVQGPVFESCVWGGFYFVLALNFKQMTLYYAPVVSMGTQCFQLWYVNLVANVPRRQLFVASSGHSCSQSIHHILVVDVRIDLCIG
jgi:ALG6, ALG8 glycosyltransferase family